MKIKIGVAILGGVKEGCPLDGYSTVVILVVTELARKHS